MLRSILYIVYFGQQLQLCYSGSVDSPLAQNTTYWLSGYFDAPWQYPILTTNKAAAGIYILYPEQHLHLNKDLFLLESATVFIINSQPAGDLEKRFVGAFDDDSYLYQYTLRGSDRNKVLWSMSTKKDKSSGSTITFSNNYYSLNNNNYYGFVPHIWHEHILFRQDKTHNEMTFHPVALDQD